MGNRLEYIKYNLNQLYRGNTADYVRNVGKANINIYDAMGENAADVTEDMIFEGLGRDEIVHIAKELEAFLQGGVSRYKKVKAAMLLSRLYYYYLPNQSELLNIGNIPYQAAKAIESKDFDSALNILNEYAKNNKYISEAVMKALGLAYRSKAYSLVEEQVRHCISSRYPDLFQLKTIADYKLSNPRYYENFVELVTMPVRIEQTSCVGSDIFYLAMDRPQKARCINISVNLLNTSSGRTEPPVSVVVRPINEKGIRFTSIDLNCTKLITGTEDLFNMRNDNLSLLKAAVIAAGIIPPAVKDLKSSISLLEVIERFMGGNVRFDGFEIVSRVMSIPKGSGLAVSTSLLAALVMALLRFSGQLPYGSAEVTDKDKMEVAARCIYGVRLVGGRGGWQDYGGMWGGFKMLSGQPADSKFDPGSSGSLLPAYEKIAMPGQAAEEIMKSLVLVNGGTGQEVGPVLKMITERYIVKDKAAWRARLRTENRFDEILGALRSGDAKMLGYLENQDFQDRKLISPLSDNLYHEETHKVLSAAFKEDLWGYDSTGGRAGAGGIYYINPDRRKEFETMYLTISERVQAELASQIHFSSKPLIFSFDVNEDGVKVMEADRNRADDLISSWMQVRPAAYLEYLCDNERIKQIKKERTYDRVLYEVLQEQYTSGKISIKNNIRGAAEEIRSIRSGVQDSNIFEMPDIGTNEYGGLFHKGEEILKEPLAYLILNGGESIRSGVKTSSGLNPELYLSGGYRCPIEMKMRHVAYMNEKFGSTIFPVFVNSILTNENTIRMLKQNSYFGVAESDVYSCMHQVIHRVYPKADDLACWHEMLGEKGITDLEGDLSEQSLKYMKEWARLKGEGSIFRPEGRNKLNTLASPGHYYSFMSIISNYTLGSLIERGVRRIMVAGSDNLLATVNPAILAFHQSKGYGATIEVVPRLLDKGGAPVTIGSKTVILEDFSFPDQETLWKVPCFKTASGWIEVDKLLKLAELTQEDLVEAAHGNREKRIKCSNAVRLLGNKLQTYAVFRRIAEDMGKGIVYTCPVIQFEKLHGDLAELLDTMFLIVPRVMRYTQMTSSDHIYQILADRALDILEPQMQF